MNPNYYAVIMAGGVGSRFWPMSKTAFPKQFHDLLGTGQSLIQKTYQRLSKIIPPKNIFILTNARYRDLVKTQLPDTTDRQIVLEPAMRNTAPCILLAALKIHQENPKASMIVAPSDHWIEDEKAFVKDVQTAFSASVRKNILMTLGIRPGFPHTGYGYIAYDKTAQTPIKPVEKFTEKPDYVTAQKFLKSGNYLWNAGIFIWSTHAIIQAFQKLLPEMYQLFIRGEAVLNTPEEREFIKKNYADSENISIDYGIMEKAGNVAVLPVSFDWNDLGSWGSLYEELAKDENDNVIINARADIAEASENIIRTSQEKVVVVKGLKNYIIVENEDVLLIYPKSEEQQIKKIRKTVQDKYGKDLG